MAGPAASADDPQKGVVDMREARIGALIRAARVERGWSQEKLAERAGTAVQTISNIENARSKSSLDVLERVANCLDLQMQTLVAPELNDVDRQRVPHVARALAALNAMNDEALVAAASQLDALARAFPKRRTD